MRKHLRPILIGAGIFVLVLLVALGGYYSDLVSTGSSSNKISAAQLASVQVPCEHMTIPPGGQEGGPGFWAHWFAVDTGQITLGEEFYAFFSVTFDSNTAWPVENFEPTFNVHVTPSNPAYNGEAAGPVQVDFNGGTAQLYARGGGTYSPSQNLYTGVQRHESGPTFTMHPGVRYDFSLHAVISLNNGFAELYVEPRDGSMSQPVLVDSVHSATMYSGDPGPLSLYYGFYTHTPQTGSPTFSGTFCMPRMGQTVSSALAHTPVITAQWGSLDFDPTVVAAAPSLDGADFAVPTAWGGTSTTPVTTTAPTTTTTPTTTAPAGTFTTNLPATVNTPFTWKFDAGVPTTAGYFWADGKLLEKVTGPGPYTHTIAVGQLTDGAHQLGHAWDLADGTHHAPASSYTVTVSNGTVTTTPTTTTVPTTTTTPTVTAPVYAPACQPTCDAQIAALKAKIAKAQTDLAP